MDYLLPASVYQSPPRLARGRLLNTIVEDNEDTSNGVTSDSEGAVSDTTVIGRPAGLDAKYFVAKPQPKQRILYPSSPQSVVSSISGDEAERMISSRSSYAGSDSGTVFSESCPSLTGSNASTTFASESSRTNSVASRSSRNQYPSILIPRGSWGSIEAETKQIPFGMSPSTKLRLSPEVLESLSQTTPDINAPPSLGDNSSVRSESPCRHVLSSLPVTPDMRNMEVGSGPAWGGFGISIDRPLEIAIDEHHSILLSPAEAHSSTNPASADWHQLMGTFPQIPGATPQEMTPVTPDIAKGFSFGLLPSDNGVQLPDFALEVLQSINRSPSPSDQSDASVREEMKECSVPRSRPRSMENQTPLSEYSFTRLSIPSPSGFFSSLKGGARRTWSSPRIRNTSPPPSSTTAENFYNTPWNSTTQQNVVETVLDIADDDTTDGPPTVRQAMFEASVKTPRETDDLYGSEGKVKIASPLRNVSSSSTHVYEHEYEEGIKQAAEANLDRTSHWLAAQTTYLSALRETNPLNDPANYPTTPARIDTNFFFCKDSLESDTVQATRFLEEANKASLAPKVDIKKSGACSPREPLLLQAFDLLRSTAKGPDSFLQASARLQSIQATRIALPKLHVRTVLNDITSKDLETHHTRPKYSGPFGQNPRATAVFDQSASQGTLSDLERQQKALAVVVSSVWTMEAQRKILYNDRLFACRAASDRLHRKSRDKNHKAHLRILDLGGAATASWAWIAAKRYPDAKVYTVQSTQQIELTVSSPRKTKVDNIDSALKPVNPPNHHVVSVPHLWQLPFKSNHFDVISARTMYMYLRSTPVPGVESIDEWDMTLKECMRVLKPGGVLDFFTMDSMISNSTSTMASEKGDINISPSAMTKTIVPSSLEAKDVLQANKSDAVAAQFRLELEKRGYEQDGGCGRLMARLKNQGFVGLKRQWVGLPMGRRTHDTVNERIHSRTMSRESNMIKSPTCTSPTSIRSPRREPAYTTHFNTDGTFKSKPNRLAPRPVSEVSSVSRVIDQYLNVEAVQGSVGSTNDIADMSALLGESLYEEWIVRLRIEAEHDIDTVLDGVHELFENWRRSGKAAWRGIVGWARKPTTSETKKIQESTVTTSSTIKRKPVAISTDAQSTTPTAAAPLAIDTSLAYHAYSQQMQEYGQQQHRSLNRHVSTLSHVTQSAVDRGDVGEIPMMIFS